MPWTSSDSARHTKKAKSPKRRRQWSKVANSILERTGDEGRAVRGANAAVNKAEAKHKVKHSGHHKGKAKHRKSVHGRKRVAGKR